MGLINAPVSYKTRAGQRYFVAARNPSPHGPSTSASRRLYFCYHSDYNRLLFSKGLTHLRVLFRGYRGPAPRGERPLSVPLCDLRRDGPQ
jgi:hypothetical protein